MKKYLILTLSIVFIPHLLVYAQVNLQAKKVEVTDVPQVVKDAYAANFTAEIIRWELHQAKKADKTGEKYVAIFKENNLDCRARFKKDGTSISYSTYFKKENLPANIKAAAEKEFAGFMAQGGQKVKVFKNNKEYYKVRLSKGAQKGVFFCDLEGNPIEKKNVPQEADEDE